MKQYVRFIIHKGTRILFINLADLDRDTALAAMAQGREIIDQMPENSLLTLTDVSGGDESREVRDAIKEFARKNKPFVRAGAVVGLTGIKKLTYTTLLALTGRDNLRLFDSLDEAKDWLVSL